MCTEMGRKELLLIRASRNLYTLRAPFGDMFILLPLDRSAPRSNCGRIAETFESPQSPETGLPLLLHADGATDEDDRSLMGLKSIAYRAVRCAVTVSLPDGPR